MSRKRVKPKRDGMRPQRTKRVDANGKEFFEPIWWLKIQRNGPAKEEKDEKKGQWFVRTCGTNDEQVANDIADMVQLLKHAEQKTALLVDRVVDKEITLRQMMALIEAENRAKGQALDARTVAANVHTKLDNPLLHSLIEDWAAEETPDRTYVRDVKLVIPENVKLEWFTSYNLRKRIVGREGIFSHCGNERRRKARVACSQFAIYLMAEDKLEFNPARGGGVRIKFTAKERQAKADPRHYSEAEVRSILDYLAQHWPDLPELRAMIALMFSTGMEWQAVKRLRKRDLIDPKLRKVAAHGGKNKWRNREVFVSIGWCWEIIQRYFASLETPDTWFLPRARDGHSRRPQEHRLRRVLLETCQELGIDTAHAEQLESDEDEQHYAFHKLRHAFAVYWIKAGLCAGKTPYSVAWLKQQLGHAPNSVLYLTTYGKYIDSAANEAMVAAAIEAENAAALAAEQDELAARRRAKKPKTPGVARHHSGGGSG